MRFVRLLVPLLAAGAVAGGVASVTAGGQGSGPPAGTLTLLATTKDGDGSFVDLPPKSRSGPSDGDEFVGRGTVADASGARAGSLDYVLKFTGRKALLRGALSLTGGKLFFEELATDGAKVTRGAIVGGTGAYAGARGDFEDRELDSAKGTTTSRITIAFVP
jgi:hypothetical protein